MQFKHPDCLICYLFDIYVLNGLLQKITISAIVCSEDLKGNKSAFQLHTLVTMPLFLFFLAFCHNAIFII